MHIKRCGQYSILAPMFLHLSVILFTRGRCTSPWADTHQADTPWANTPWADTTPGLTQRHTPWADTPLGGRPLQRMVPIALKCILVLDLRVVF